MLREFSDGWALRSVRNGDTEAFAGIVRRYSPAVYAVAYAHMSNRSDAEDVVQETFAKALKALDSVRDAGALRPWLTAIARNTARSWLMKQARERDALDALPRISEGPVAHSAALEQQELVHRNLQRLDAAHREILLMHYFAEMSVRDIAHAQACTPSAVKKRLQRARESLGRQVLRGMALPGEKGNMNELRRRVLTGLGIGAASATSWAWGGAAAAAALTLLGLWGPWGYERKGDGEPLAVLTESSVNAPVPGSAPPILPPAPAETSLPETGNGAEATAPTPASIPPPSIRGVVVDAAGRHVADAEVKWWIDGEVRADAMRTEVNGSFRFDEDLSPYSSIRLQASAGGLAGPAAGPFRTDERGAVDGIVVRVTTAARISGVAVNEAGEPLAGQIRAQAKRPNWNHGVSEPIDEQGRFEIAGLYDGAFTLQYGMSEREWIAIPEYTSVMLKPGEHLRDILVVIELATADGPIAGYVVDDGGDPIGEAPVRLSGVEGVQHTDADGRFEFAGLLNRSYEVVVEVEGFGTWANSKRPGDPEFTVQLTRSWEVRGRLVDALSGSPVVGASFTITAGTWASWPYVRLRGAVDASGRFSERSHDPVRDLLYVLAEGYEPVVLRISEWTEKDWKGERTIAMKPVKTIDGIVLNPAGEPVPDAWIFAGLEINRIHSDLGDSQRGGSGIPRSDGQGRFRLSVYPQGAQMIGAYHRDFSLGSVPWPEDGSDVVVRLTEGGRLRGTAYVNGKPAQGLVIELNPAGKTTTSASDGTYEIRGIPPGRYWLGTFLHAIHSDDPNLQFGHSFSQELDIRDGREAVADIGFRPGSIPFTVKLSYRGEAMETAGYFVASVLLAYPMGDGEEYFYVNPASGDEAHWPSVHEGDALLKLIAWRGEGDSEPKPPIPVRVAPGGVIEVDVADYWQ